MMKKEFKMSPVTRFVAWFILGIIVCIIGISNVNALSSTTSYSSYSNGTLGGSGKYNYGYLSGGVQNFTTANIGSTISGVSYGFMFYYSQNISLGNTYTLVINFVSSDLLASVTSNWVKISTCNSSTCNDNTLISMVKSNPSGYSNKVTFKFNPVSVGSVIRFEMGGDNNQPLTGVSNFGISSIQVDVENPSQDIINNQTNNTNNIINNNNSNTQDIINNNNSNTQDIIDNQNENTNSVNNTIENVLGSDCQNTLFNESNIFNGLISSNTLTANNGTRSYYFLASNNTTYSIQRFDNGSGLGTRYVAYICNGITAGSTCSNETQGNNSNNRLIITTGSSGTQYVFVYVTNNVSSIPVLNIFKGSNSFSTSFTNKFCNSKLDETTDAINGINDSINDDNVDSSSWANFFNNFTTNTFGLTSIVTAPLNLIQSLTSTTCADLQLPLPYLQNKYLTLPCMSTIYSQYFGTFFTLYQTITYGIIAYWVCVRIFNLVKDFKNPDHDEIEVVDL